MAGDWIKMRVDLANDPAVISIATQTKKIEDTIVGKLHRLWSWADSHTRDGRANGVTADWIDKHVACRGFAAAMANEGWLILGDGFIQIPSFDKHNGKSAKTRAEASERKRKERDESVTLSQKSCDKSVTREEKRREEKNNTPAIPAIELRKKKFEADLAAMQAKGIQ